MKAITGSVSACSLLVGLLLGTSAIAQAGDWHQLNQEMESLYQQRNLQQAAIVAERAAKQGEKEFGANHEAVARSHSLLAMSNKELGKYAEARQSYLRALAIYEATRGPEDRAVAVILRGLGKLSRLQKNDVEAEDYYRRSLSINTRLLNKEQPDLELLRDIGEDLREVGQIKFSQGNYNAAEEAMAMALAIHEAALPPDDPSLAFYLDELAELYDLQGKPVEAVSLRLRARTLFEKAYENNVPNNIIERTEFMAWKDSDIALALAKTGRSNDAEKILLKSLAEIEKFYGLDHLNATLILDRLGLLYLGQQRLSEAEAAYRRSLAIREKVNGPDSASVANTKSLLAGVLTAQSRFAEAEELYLRSLKTLEKSDGPEGLHLASALGGLGGLLERQGRHAEVEVVLKRLLLTREKLLPAGHIAIASSHSDLARLYRKQGRIADAENAYALATDILAASAGQQSSAVIHTLIEVADFYEEKGNYTDAATVTQKVIDLRIASLGPSHHDVAESRYDLAYLHLRLGQSDRALAESRRATAIYRTRIVEAATVDDRNRESAMSNFSLKDHVDLLALNLLREPTSRIADEALQAAQLMQATGTANAVAKMSARFARGDGELAKLVRDRQDAEARRARAETNLTGAFGKTAQERNPALEQRLRDDIAAAGKAIEAIDAELARRFPEYQELARLQPVSVDEVRALLKPGEAMLAYTLAGDTAYLWVVNSDGAQFLPLKAKVAEILAKLAKVRSQMEFSPEGNAPRVSVEVLHELHQALIAPALPHLSGISHLLIVPDGALQSLPFGMLVASPPPAIATDADYRQVDWLARHYAMSVLPAVGSIKALRQFAKADGAKEPFAGFGDPLIGDAEGMSRGKRAKVDIATVFRGSKVRGAAGQPLPTLEIADVEAIRKTPRLPETADELRQIGKALKAGPDSIWLQQKATETAVKGMDLSKYQTLAFATHGMMAGEVGGVGEPGLILTPPKAGTLDDDGYLAASEIAKLRLNADWTILSACNTASADGTPGAEGLSGLAKAFFYAGSRSLLVSHWPVASDATVPLTSKMLAEYKANPAQGKAEAHRKSMLALMESADHPEFAHPIYWAPFVVVGEGGANQP